MSIFGKLFGNESKDYDNNEDRKDSEVESIIRKYSAPMEKQGIISGEDLEEDLERAAHYFGDNYLGYVDFNITQIEMDRKRELNKRLNEMKRLGLSGTTLFSQKVEEIKKSQKVIDDQFQMRSRYLFIGYLLNKERSIDNYDRHSIMFITFRDFASIIRRYNYGTPRLMSNYKGDITEMDVDLLGQIMDNYSGNNSFSQNINITSYDLDWNSNEEFPLRLIITGQEARTINIYEESEFVIVPITLNNDEIFLTKVKNPGSMTETKVYLPTAIRDSLTRMKENPKEEKGEKLLVEILEEDPVFRTQISEIEYKDNIKRVSCNQVMFVESPQAPALAFGFWNGGIIIYTILGKDIYFTSERYTEAHNYYLETRL